MTVVQDSKPKTVLVPNAFSTTARAIASYDWLDITSGVGYRKYYGAVSTLTGGATYFLTPRATIDSNPLKTPDVTVTNNDYALKQEIDFDITFDVPAIIASADALVNILIHLESITEACWCYSVITIYHVGVPTSIGTAQSPNRVTTGSARTEYHRESVLIALTQKKFAVGDILRLNVKIYAKEPLAGSGKVSFYCDPSSRKTVTDELDVTSGTDLIFDVPFKVDV